MTPEERLAKAYDIALGLKSASSILETYTQNVDIQQAEIDNIYWIAECLNMFRRAKLMSIICNLTFSRHTALVAVSVKDAVIPPSFLILNQKSGVLGMT